MKLFDPPAVSPPAANTLRDRTYELLEISENSIVLSVGCGPAGHTLELARRAGPGGLVTGIDNDPERVALANSAAMEAGLGTMVRHVLGQATRLPLADDQGDALLCDGVHQYLGWEGSMRLCAEAWRVLGPNRRVVFVDTDWGSFSVAASNVTLERRIAFQHCLGIPHPFAGRYLPILLRESGFVDIQVETFNLPVSYEALVTLLGPTIHRGLKQDTLTPTGTERWSWDLRYLRDRHFFAHLSTILVAARHP